MMQFSKETKKRLAEVCKKYGVGELSLFGSRSRGDHHDQSDCDFIVEFLPDAGVGLIEFASVKLELEGLLGTGVDLVPKAGLKKRIRNRILAESMNVYAG